MDATIEIWNLIQMTDLKNTTARVTTRELLEIASHQKVVGH